MRRLSMEFLMLKNQILYSEKVYAIKVSIQRKKLLRLDSQ
nr:MAG TPA: hypothetical protein [Caudoviricetes sp.]